MLTVELRNGDQALLGRAEVEVYCDLIGLKLLIAQLEHLEKGSSHVHLMTESWAGNELDEKTLGGNTTLINHLRITVVPTQPIL